MRTVQRSSSISFKNWRPWPISDSIVNVGILLHATHCRSTLADRSISEPIGIAKGSPSNGGKVPIFTADFAP
ncbi:hypothetical protein Tco_0185702 [Tanacetum coccineum]